MKVRIDRTRMAMSGHNYAYDVTVNAADCPHVPQHNVTRIIKDGWGNGEWLRFEDATTKPEHYQMELGWERYQDALQHEKTVQPIMLGLVQRAFPETAELEKMPTLWVEIPGFDERHDTRYVDVAL